MRIIGVDYGDARIGVSVSDPTCLIASSLETIKNSPKAIELFCALINEYNAAIVVFGLPMNMDGSEGERARVTREFAQQIEQASGVKVDFIDERLTSKAAERTLIQAEVRREKRNALIDKLAAQMILQSYLDKKCYKKFDLN